MKAQLALRIEVPGYRAARRALPLLTEILQRQNAVGSFVFALAPDWLGRSVTRLAPALQQLRDAGFESGVSGWQRRDWLKLAARADAAWSEAQYARAATAFEQVFAAAPRLHAAPGWRSNPHALRLTQRRGFAYASDTRGRHPFVPVWHGEIVRCPQIPTTLPTLDELADQTDAPAARDQLLALTASPPASGHVFSLRLAPGFAKQAQRVESLLSGWREQGYEVTSIRTLAEHLEMDKLPRHEVVIGKVPGCEGTLLLQGEEFLSDWRSHT